MKLHEIRTAAWVKRHHEKHSIISEPQWCLLRNGERLSTRSYSHVSVSIAQLGSRSGSATTWKDEKRLLLCCYHSDFKSKSGLLVKTMWKIEKSSSQFSSGVFPGCVPGETRQWKHGICESSALSSLLLDMHDRKTFLLKVMFGESWFRLSLYLHSECLLLKFSLYSQIRKLHPLKDEWSLVKLRLSLH